MITSAQNPKLKFVRTLLGRSKERREARSFVAEGIRLVEEALTAEWSFQYVLHTEELGERGATLLKGLKARNIECEIVDGHLLQSLSDTDNTQGIIAVLNYSPLPIPRSLDFIIVLDAIRDPGNLGTLLRTAAAAGVQAVFLPPEATDAFGPKVVRAGMGAHFHLPILSLDWETLRAYVHGLKVYLAEMEGDTPYWKADFRAPLALIVGSEAEGASQPARHLASQLVYIPMPGGSESLNAAVAGAILMFEVVRQRKSARRRN